MPRHEHVLMVIRASTRRIACRRFRAVLPVALLGLHLQGCASVSHRGHPTAPSAAARSRQHVATRGTIPAEFLDLVTTKKAFANLATVMPGGSPQVTPVWFDFDGRYIRVNSARGRVKDRNMRRDARVALSILDPDDPYRYLEIRGRVVQITEEGAVEHTNRLARKYLGVDANPNRRPDQVRVMYVIQPRRVAGQG
jgi:PPOX class probable F420-dependent enzyme